MSHNLDSARNTSGINLSGLHRKRQGHSERTSREEYRSDTYAISEQAEDGLPLGVFLYKNYRYIIFSFNPVRFVVTVSLTRTAALYLYLVCTQQSTPSYIHHSLAYIKFSVCRSHRRILEVPSALFYGGALQECADPAQVNSLCGWDKLPQTDGASFPLLMIGEFMSRFYLCFCGSVFV